jgi:ribosomal protein S12 methylthiotransferase accessory factor
MQMKVSFPGNLKVNAEFAGFTVATDQPVLAGGDGSAPAPFDLFLASLATCAGIFMLAFLKQRGLTTEGTGITMTMERDPATHLVSDVGFELHLPGEVRGGHRARGRAVLGQTAPAPAPRLHGDALAAGLRLSVRAARAGRE